MRGLVISLALLVAVSGAAAQSSRYAPIAGGERTQKLIDELSTLIDEAERARAADPRFLYDLRDLIRKYDRPWRTEILRDDFRDGNYTVDPTWTIKTGRFEVDARRGLLSRVTPGRQEPATTGSREDLATAIVGSLLSQALGGKRQDPSPPSPSEPDYAQIYVAAPIPETFEIRLEISSRQRQGRLAVGPYVGADQSRGYSLAYNPGASPGLELLRVEDRGSRLLTSRSERLDLEDGRSHLLEWTRDQAGEMVVKVDGKEMLRARDEGFRGRFEGFTFVNMGGEYELHRVVVNGTPSR